MKARIRVTSDDLDLFCDIDTHLKENI